MTSVLEPDTGETFTINISVLVVRFGKRGAGPTTVSALRLTITPAKRWPELDALRIQRKNGAPAFAPRVNVRVNTTSELLLVRVNRSVPKIAKLPP